LPGPEVFVPFDHPPGRAPTVTEIRSTLIVSSIQSLRSHGRYDQYAGLLGSREREDLLSLIAGTWVPLQLAQVHYGTLERMGLDRAEIEVIGGDVADRVNRSILSTIVRASSEAGMTPWTLLSHTHRLRDLMWRGSDIAILKLGPKEARFDWASQPLASVPYFVTSFGGYLRAMVGLFCLKAYTRQEREGQRSDRIVYRISWA
jgi:hypothetical protein